MFSQTKLIKFAATQTLFVLILLVDATAQNPKAVAGAQYHLKRGNDYAAREKWQHAIAEYDEALVMDGKNAAAYDARGLTWLALEDVGMALRDFNRGLKLTPDNPTLYAHRGQAWQAQGKPREAERDFARHRELITPHYSAKK
jgi:tetratricopeptide (TPR) repeat protein